MRHALAAAVLALLPAVAGADLAEIKASGKLRVLYVPSSAATDDFLDVRSTDRPGFDRPAGRHLRRGRELHRGRGRLPGRRLRVVGHDLPHELRNQNWRQGRQEHRWRQYS